MPARRRAGRGRVRVSMAVALCGAALALSCGGRRVASSPERPRGFSAAMSVAARDEGGAAWRGHGLVAVAPPDRLRVEIHDPVGRTRGILVVTEARATAVMGDACAETEGGAELLERLLGPRVSPGALVRVLLGGGPDEGELEPGVAYVRVRGEDDEWTGTLRLEAPAGDVEVRLADHEPLGSAAPFRAPSTAGRRRVTVDELVTELRR